MRPLPRFQNISFLWTTLLGTLAFGPRLVGSFPQGAPSDVCESFSPQRGHKVPPHRVEQSPFRLIQYGQHYRPGEIIGVEILPINTEEEEAEAEAPLFRGFLVQALDAQTFEFIGHFAPGEGLHLLPECSAVTHQNAKRKTSAGFLWQAPDFHSGEVIFRATIVQEKEVYFQNILAEVH